MKYIPKYKPEAYLKFLNIMPLEKESLRFFSMSFLLTIIFSILWAIT